MTTSPIKKLVATITIMLASVTGLMALFFIVSTNVQNYGNTMRDTRARIALGETDFQRITTIAELIKTRKPDIDRMRRITIDRSRPLVFIETLERISHLTNTEITLAIDEKKGGSDALFFSATIEGSVQNIRTMLALIINLPYDIAIDNIAFQHDATLTQASQGVAHVMLGMRVKTQ